MYRYILLAFCLTFLLPLYAHASFQGDGWHTLPHPPVLTFSVDANGNAHGLVEGNIPFRQYTILEEAGLRVQRFELLDHFHFIVNGDVVYTFDELSVALSYHS